MCIDCIAGIPNIAENPQAKKEPAKITIDMLDFYGILDMIEPEPARDSRQYASPANYRP